MIKAGSEDVNSFFNGLNEAAGQCKFESRELHSRLLDTFVAGVNLAVLTERLLNERKLT